LASFDDGSSPVLVLSNDGGSGSAVASLCKGGHYVGTFDGSYESSYAGGIPLTVSGNVDMTLNAYGSPKQTCVFMGETDVCSNFFQLSGGTITGVANKTMIGDASVGGFPYFCFMTGTLDCKAKKLVGGWIQCVYCVVGVISDGGMGCDPSVAGLGTGIAGKFAGPLTANYDTGTLAFVNGTWNGAEELAGNNGKMPGPDGATRSFVPCALYLLPGDSGPPALLAPGPAEHTNAARGTVKVTASSTTPAAAPGVRPISREGFLAATPAACHGERGVGCPARVARLGDLPERARRLNLRVPREAEPMAQKKKPANKTKAPGKELGEDQLDQVSGGAQVSFDDEAPKEIGSQSSGAGAGKIKFVKEY
jgi:hypothetical protein